MSFKLPSYVVEEYSKKPLPFGFNGLGNFVYQRTYSRVKDDGTNESWPETVERVVNGVYSMQKNWVESRGLGWEEEKAMKSALEMYDRIFHIKFTPPGRGLWAMGTQITDQKGIYAALNNCCFTSTENIDKEKSAPFRFLMDMSMLGVGCGFDVKGAGKIVIHEPNTSRRNLPEDVQKDHSAAKERYLSFLRETIAETRQKLDNTPEEWFRDALSKDIQMYTKELEFVELLEPDQFDICTIGDNREGWVKATGIIIESYFEPEARYILCDYSKIRKKGIPLKTFGGLASGPVPLLDLHTMIRCVLSKNMGAPITIKSIVDIMNLIGRCVVAGNVRRSSEIALGPRESSEFIDLKDYAKNPDRLPFGWCSNNSVFGKVGMDYTEIAERIKNNGEPGVFWLDHAREYSRMNEDGRDFKDMRVLGTNPCAEQSLCDKEMCTLCEVYPTRCENKEDFLRTLKFAYLYGKTVTLGDSHWVETNRVMMRNRRIGCSLTGITQFLAKYNIDTLKEWCEEGYDVIQNWDQIYSEWLCIPRSIKTTSIKPSGCGILSSKIAITDSVGSNTTPMSYQEIFEKNGYNIEEHMEQQDRWLPPTRDMFVRDENNVAQKITNLYINGRAKVYKIPLADGTELYYTAEHKWRVLLADGSTEWKCTADLEAGDHILSH